MSDFNDDCKAWFLTKGMKITFHKQKQRYYAKVKLCESTKESILETCKNDSYGYISKHVKRWYPDASLTSFGGDSGTFFLYTFEDIIKDNVKQINQKAIEDASKSFAKELARMLCENSVEMKKKFEGLDDPFGWSKYYDK